MTYRKSLQILFEYLIAVYFQFVGWAILDWRDD